MTITSNFSINLLLLFVSLTSCKQNYIDIHLNSFNHGKYCYILWTSDTTKCNSSDPNLTLKFDTNNVVYVHRSLKFDKKLIRIFDESEQDISKNMINIMGDIEDNYMDFYCPTKEEIKLHPHYDEYYQNELLMPNNSFKRRTIFDLEKMGYIVERKK